MGYRTSPGSFPYSNVKFDKEFLEKINILGLQDKFSLPVHIKIKSRMDEKQFHDHDWEDTQEYIADCCPRGLEFTVQTDVFDNNTVVSKAAAIISAPSTLSFKAIHAGAPTAIIRDSGQMGNLFDFQGVVDCDKKQVLDTIMRKMDQGRDDKWLGHTLEGSLTYSATEVYTNKIREILND